MGRIETTIPDNRRLAVVSYLAILRPRRVLCVYS